MSEQDPSKIDQLLDLLLDALNERQAARQDVPPQPVSTPLPGLAPQAEPRPEPAPPLPAPPQADEAALAPLVADELLPEPASIPEKLPSIQLDRMLSRLAMAMGLLLILVNIPFNRFGTNLARAMPDAQALVIRDGLVFKGSGSEIYVLQDNHRRWISSLDAFNYYGYRWEQVKLVDEDFLAQFPDGPPLSILYKCASSPHVYAIENGSRRWIKDIPTFEAQGYVWEDVQIVPCSRIQNLPAGPPIPPDAGEPGE